jgi:hypothetical protein
VKTLPPDLAKEIEIDRTQGSGIKSSITTHTGLSSQKANGDKPGTSSTAGDKK